MEDAEEIVKKIINGVYKLRKKPNAKSVIWKLFSEIERENGEILDEKVFCEGCQRVFKYKRKQTSNLIKHKCVHLHPRDSSPVPTSATDKNDCFEVFLNFIVEDCRTFSIVEGSGFRKMIEKCIKIGAKYGEYVDLDKVIPSAQALSERCKLMAEEKKEEIKPRIKDLIENGEAAVTIDLWTDNFLNRNFLCASLHYQIDFKIVNISLGMKSMDFMSNNPANIRDTLNSLFEEFGVTDLSRIVFVTDRRMNIKDALQDVTRLHCSTDLFSNFLNDAFELTTELIEITQSCREIVKYFEKAKMQHMLKTTLNSCCPTKWNIQFAMFKSIYDNYENVNIMLVDNTETSHMLDFNMSLLQGLVELGNDFDFIFNKFQDTTSPTLCYVIPSINRIQMICNSKFIDDDGIVALKRNILLQLENWRLNLSIWHKAAVFLYPPAISIQSNDIFEIKEFCMEQIITEKEIILPHAAKNENYDSTTSEPSPTTPSDFNNYSRSQYSSFPSTSASSSTAQNSTSAISFFFPNLVKNVSSSIPENVRDEVELYAAENIRLTDDFDVMQWWKNNADKYPKLSKLAAKILSIPASSITSDRVLSLAGNILIEKRKDLETNTFDSILFLNAVNKRTI